MAYKVIILYQLYMPSYFLGTFTEYPFLDIDRFLCFLFNIPIRKRAIRGFLFWEYIYLIFSDNINFI